MQRFSLSMNAIFPKPNHSTMRPIPRLFAAGLCLWLFLMQGCNSKEQEPRALVPITSAPTTAVPGLEKLAATLAATLGKPSRLLIGLGSTDATFIASQTLHIDIYDQYINGVGTDSWIHWNTPAGAYIDIVAKDADSIGATPMFTMYQMAALGDGNLLGLGNTQFMKDYWHNVEILLQRLNVYNKPVLINLEPDFWGYAQRAFIDPGAHFVHVTTDNRHCSNQPNNMIGFGHCLIQMTRVLAPKALAGFPPSLFPDLAATEVDYMLRVGASKGDFLVMQTSDRDAGCFEAKYTGDNASCDRPGGLLNSWDASNQSAPNFKTHLKMARRYFEGIQKPLLWWQTPLGVASEMKGGRPGAFRDNKVAYFLSHPQELVDAGGVGIVFSAGHTSQTTLATDEGQFKKLSEKYFQFPTLLP